MGPRQGAPAWGTTSAGSTTPAAASSGADWLTALLVFEALDNDYVYVDAPGGEFGEGGWGDWGGDWGDFGGGGTSVAVAISAAEASKSPL